MIDDVLASARAQLAGQPSPAPCVIPPSQLEQHHSLSLQLRAEPGPASEDEWVEEVPLSFRTADVYTSDGAEQSFVLTSEGPSPSVEGSARLSLVSAPSQADDGVWATSYFELRVTLRREDGAQLETRADLAGVVVAPPGGSWGVGSLMVDVQDFGANTRGDLDLAVSSDAFAHLAHTR